MGKQSLPFLYLVEKVPTRICCTAHHQVQHPFTSHTRNAQKTHVFNVPYDVPGSRFSMQESGYFTSNTFPDTIRHLMEYSPPGKKLFILDGHDSHLDVDALDM